MATRKVTEQAIAEAMIAIQNIRVYDGFTTNVICWKDSKPYDTDGFVWGDIWPHIHEDKKKAAIIWRELYMRGYVQTTEYDENENPVAYALTSEGCEWAP